MYELIFYILLCFGMSLQFCAWFLEEEGELTVGMALASFFIGFLPIFNLILYITILLERNGVPTSVAEILDKRIM